jgi:restriction system protein
MARGWAGWWGRRGAAEVPGRPDEVDAAEAYLAEPPVYAPPEKETESQPGGADRPVSPPGPSVPAQAGPPHIPGSRRARLAEQYTEAAEDAEQRLEELLAVAAEPPPAVDFESLRRRYEPRPLPTAAEALGEPPRWEEYEPEAEEAPPEAPGRPLLTGGYQRQLAEARLAYQKALREHRQRELALQEEAERLREEHEQEERARQRTVTEFNAALDASRRDYEDGRPAAVESVVERALAAATGRLSELPGLPGLPGTARVRFRPLTRTALIDLALPAPGIVPAALTFRAAEEGVEGVPRPAAEVRARYQQLIARLALRALHAALAADSGGLLYGIVLNGRVGTAGPESPCLFSVDARYEDLIAAPLLPSGHAEAVERLRALPGRFSPDPYQQQPVAPLAGESGELPTAEELSPGEFAALVAELTEHLGLTGWEPRLTGRDGLLGVARDARGRGVVLCAARRPPVIGAEAVHNAAEVAEEEGLDQCIWITTGAYHAEALGAARNRPGMRLIDGQELRDLIRTRLGPELGG